MTALNPLQQILDYEAAPLVIWSQQQKEELIQLPMALLVGLGLIEVNCQMSLSLKKCSFLTSFFIFGIMSFPLLFPPPKPCSLWNSLSFL